MNKMNYFWMAIAMISAIFVGCSSEEPMDDPVEPIAATVSLVEGTGFVNSVDTVETGATFVMSVSVLSGNSPLTSIEVLENGTNMDVSRITFDGDPAQSNPNPLGSVTSLDWEITLVSQEVDGVADYDVIITDSLAQEAVLTVSITTETPSPAVQGASMYLLRNQSGPAGQGGLDVDTGDETGTTTGNFTAADIRDQGSDFTLPLASNWIQKIAPINGTTLKAADAALVWDEIQTVEDLTVADAAATTIVDESEVVAEGDIFFVESTEGKLFALVVTDIVVTPDNNEDRYEFDVKFE